jgi:2,4-dienoyl-CoA reductase-like NADH-dependent reductase (Old Yellow Enzyme family)
MTSHLFQPITINGLRLENRIVIPPMCQYSAEEGSATDWHMIHLGHLALSGAGLLILEATAVEPEGRITPDDLGLWSDENEAALERVLAGLRKYSTMPIGIQLAHAGRKSSSQVPWDGGQQIPLAQGGWRAFGPSAVPHNDFEEPPVELDRAGLDRVRDAFAAAARRSERVGLDLIEIHGAHGYLMHEFLSPISNKRSDAYGGSLENRMRFPLEVYDAVRDAVSSRIPVGYRISATDWVEGGWDLEEALVFCRALKERGVSFLHVSSGGVSSAQKIPLAPNYQVPFAAAVKRETGIPTIAVGLITEPEQAEQIVASGEADMVGLARAMLYDPRWAWHAAAKFGTQVTGPKQYWRSQPRELKDLFAGARTGQR